MQERYAEAGRLSSRLRIAVAAATTIAVLLFGAVMLGGISHSESGSARAQITDTVINSAPALKTAVAPAVERSELRNETATQAVLDVGSVRIGKANVFWDYVTCITGVGVPLGAAIGIVTYLGTTAAFSAARATNGAILPGIAGPMFRWYGQKIWNACGRFIRS